jgi:hypothetical protein
VKTPKLLLLLTVMVALLIVISATSTFTVTWITAHENTCAVSNYTNSTAGHWSLLKRVASLPTSRPSIDKIHIRHKPENVATGVLVSISDEVIEQVFRSAAVDSG